MDRKKTRIGTIMLMLGVAISGNAQSGVTYNHDSSKKNQITVMEIGSGSLSPELYYQLLHSSYKKSAASKNKLGYRTTAGIGAYNQVEYAEAIDSALTKRAEIEALNVADRQIDLAWKAEGSMINRQLDKMQANINHIVPTGGSIEDRKRWQELYDMFQCAVKATRNAYMPNAQRKVEYLRIYADLAKQNETLVKFLVQCNMQSNTNDLLAATYEKNINKGGIVGDARSRWMENMKAVRGNYRDDGSEGEGDESVNR